jgi:hypothetical protein
MLVSLAVAILAAVAAAGWFALHARDPTDFADGARVDLANYQGPNPTGVPPLLAGADPVARGQYLTRAADCVACHTAPGGKPFAGGRGFKLPFGTLYSTNITPTLRTALVAGATRILLGPCTRASAKTASTYIRPFPIPPTRS